MSGNIVLLFYVDDIIITGSDVADIHSLINSLSWCFEMKVTKVLHYIWVWRSLAWSLSSDSNQVYFRFTPACANMLVAKPISTPVSFGSKLFTFQGAFLAYVSLYRSLVGALKYLLLQALIFTYFRKKNVICLLLNHYLSSSLDVASNNWQNNEKEKN